MKHNNNVSFCSEAINLKCCNNKIICARKSQHTLEKQKYDKNYESTLIIWENMEKLDALKFLIGNRCNPDTLAKYA